MEILEKIISLNKCYSSESYVRYVATETPDKVLYLPNISRAEDYKYLMYIAHDILWYSGIKKIKYFNYLIYTSGNLCISDNIVYSRVSDNLSNYQLTCHNNMCFTKYNNKIIALQHYKIGNSGDDANMYFDLYGSLLKINYYHMSINMENISVQDVVKMNYAVPLPIIIA